MEYMSDLIFINKERFKVAIATPKIDIDSNYGSFKDSSNKQPKHIMSEDLNNTLKHNTLSKMKPSHNNLRAILKNY